MKIQTYFSAEASRKGIGQWVAVGAVLGALLLSACASVTPTSAPATEAPTAVAAAATQAPTAISADTPTAGTAVTTTSSDGVTLNVFAAASLQDVFTEMGKNFETANPGAKVAFNFAGGQGRNNWRSRLARAHQPMYLPRPIRRRWPQQSSRDGW